jgi:O-antigen/teichoic acid export membrane protein
VSVQRDSAYLLGANIGQAALALLTGVLTARLLGPAGKGELYVVVQLASTVGLILAVGLGPSYQYHVARNLMDRAAIMSHLWVQLATAAIVAILLARFGTPILKMITGASLSQAMYDFTCVAIVTNVALLYGSSILMVMPRGPGMNSILGVTSAASNALLLVVFLGLLHYGVVAAIVIYISSVVLRLLPTFVVITQGTWRSLSLGWLGSSRPLFTYGAGAFVSNVMVSSVFRIDVFIVSAIRGAAEVGIYSVAVALAEIVLMAPNALGTALFAHLPALSEQERLPVVLRSARLTFTLAGAVGAAAILASYPAVHILMGSRYAAAVVPLVLLVPGLVAMSVNYVFANYLGAKGSPAISAACFGVGLIANVLIDFAVVPSYGIVGAAVGSSIAYALITVAFIVNIRREKSFPIRELLIATPEDLLLVREKVAAAGRLMLAVVKH